MISLVVEAVNPESHEGGEVRELCGIALPGIECSVGLIEKISRNLELIRVTQPMNEKPCGIDKVCPMVLCESCLLRQVLLTPKLETRRYILLLYLRNLVVDRSRANQFWKLSRSFKKSGHFCFDAAA